MRGIDGLRDRPKGHRQALLSEENKREISKWLDSSKTPDGKDINWTLETLCRYIKLVLDIDIKKSALSNTLKKMSYVIRKPLQLTLMAQRKKGMTLQKTLDLINQFDEEKSYSIYFFDEARFGLQSSLCRKWAKRGSE
ncbi:MAG: hypothetical protein V3576_01670 [Candidatus Cloacimonadota bacterium]